jgi:hypothetical protein
MSTAKPLISGISIVLAYTIIDPLMEDIQDTFGKGFLYHPFAIWLCIVMLVYTQTSSFRTGIAVVLIYELCKGLWKAVKPEPPRVGKLRKLLHRVQNDEPLSDRDVRFLDDITPRDVKVARAA